MNAISGVNASVVALLFATLLTTVAPAGINGFFDFILAIIGLIIVRFSGLSILRIILIFIVVGIIKSYLGI
jgi:chromate transporter